MITSIAAGAAGLYLAASRRRVNDANAAEALINAAMALVGSLQKDVKDLTERVASQDRWSEKQDEAITKLERQHEECLEREAALSARLNGLEA